MITTTIHGVTKIESVDEQTWKPELGKYKKFRRLRITTPETVLEVWCFLDDDFKEE